MDRHRHYNCPIKWDGRTHAGSHIEYHFCLGDLATTCGAGDNLHDAKVEQRRPDRDSSRITA